MKSVLVSIQPKLCELIANGKKTIEVRKTKPKLETPFKVYIYCTKGELLTRSNNNGKIYVASSRKYQKALERNGNITLSGKVIGEFVCKKLTYIGADFDRDGIRHLYNTAFIENRMCIELNELFDYLYPKGGWGWHISNLVIYEKPRELNEFIKPCIYGDESDISCFCCEKSGYGLDMHIKCFNKVTRPPQSWCYVQSEVSE